ncbi:NAD-dependent epimerase dehydratase [Verticillium dahliae]
MVKVLLTGGSGFIGGHILEQLLEQGHDAVVTVRSEDKAQKIRDDYKDLAAGRLTVAIVPDIAREDAFDEVVKSPGLEAVLHTASPFHFNFSNVCPLPRKPLCCCPPFLLTRALLLTAATADPKKDLIDPAVIGTTAILQALHRSAPGVKRVVITSSFASIIDEARVTDPTKIFTERDWNPVTEADMTQSKATAYRASKKLAERAAWDFVAAAAPAPTFDLVTICPPLVLGPVGAHLASLDAINTSNERLVQLLRGDWKARVADTGAAVLWVDVRDCAAAHLRALEAPAAAGRRLFTTAGWFSNREIAAVVRENFPELADRLPGPEVEGGEFPPKDKVYGYDNTATNEILGIQWIGLEKSIVDSVKQLQSLPVWKTL